MNSRNPIDSISSSDLIDAKLEEHRTCGSKHCPGCGHKLERKPDWVGLPAGVKFDPTDQELIEHLEAQVKLEDLRSHPLIDEFIPTIEGEDGICYTHPEKLPGVTRDGLSKHFFHRPSKAYTTGTRKRRKIQTECDLQGGETRWHKTGKTRPVMVNGKQKGCKKILVLYTNFGKHRKPEKTNWVMHQYHLGELEEEKEGELVVSKIFYQTQPRQCNWSSEKGGGGGAPVVVARAAALGEQQHCMEHRRDSGSGSSSSKEVVGMRDDLSSVAAGISGYGAAADMQHIRGADSFSFAPFGKSFDEVGMGEATAKARDHASRTCDEHQERAVVDGRHGQPMPLDHMTVQEQQRQAAATGTAAYHICRPSNPISGMLSPAVLHQTSIVLDEAYQRLLLQNERLQQPQEQVQHHMKLVGRPAAGLEELIMGCTSGGLRGETPIPNSQETEWLKYSYWPDPDNPDHHG